MNLHQLESWLRNVHIYLEETSGKVERHSIPGIAPKEKSVMSLDFIKNLTSTKEATLDFLKLHSVIRRLPPDCLNCFRPMTFVRKSNRKCGYIWHCPDRRCGESMSPLNGSFFEKTRLAPEKVLEIMWCWANQMPNKTAGNFSNTYL